MVREHQTVGDSEGQGSLVCYSPWGRKELDMTQHQGNANQNHCEISLQTHQDGYNKYVYIYIGEDVKELELSYIAGRNVKWYGCCGKQCRGSSKCQNYQ